jgi:hypothetical protein
MINTQTATPTSSRALPSAASTSARCSPKVRFSVAARVASDAAMRAKDEARHVGQYVAGIGEQCKRPGDETADHLSDEHSAADHEDDNEPLAVGAGRRHLVAVSIAHASTSSMTPTCQTLSAL